MPGSLRVTVGDRYKQWVVGTGGPGNILYIVVNSFCLIKIKALLIRKDIALFFSCLADHEIYCKVSLAQFFFLFFEKLDNNP